ncbi:hypothetical protein HQ489_01090 [Candidatus Woesearchaeota archaeon]|nr:hypothetical protein [Candidatus Woesearchaeota archaeon]
MDRSELLVKYGFVKPDARKKYELDSKTGMFKSVEGEEFSSKDAHEEVTEILPKSHYPTGFPVPVKSYRLSYEISDLSLEGPYFWVLDTLKDGFKNVDKVEDTFAAAENSAFFGVSQQRLGAQQDRISTFLANIGRMIKELFQMVRELRIIDERLGYYKSAEEQLDVKDLNKRERRSEITLKGLFVDLVQGGGKSPASVYGMAQQLEFITLPNLFFDAPPFKEGAELEKYVNDLEKDFNRNVLRVLKRHLNQFYEWKKRTHKEHEDRRRFQLAYLLQHYEIIQMYVAWIKPHLKNTEKLQLKDKNMRSADLVASFEGSMLDIELLAHTPTGEKGNAKVNECLLCTFNYRTRVEMKVHQEGYNRGPVHVGRMELNLRVYKWTDQEIKNYKAMKKKEIFYLMGDISETLQKAMTGLGKELEIYLEEAKKNVGAEYDKELLGEVDGKKEFKKKNKGFVEGFFGEFYTGGAKKKDPKKKPKDPDWGAIEKWRTGSKVGTGTALAWVVFNNFKKAHRMIAW